MATLAMGIVGGDMPWPLVVVGMAFGVFNIMVRVKSPMLVAVGMYLPFNTTFSMFIGGLLRWLVDRLRVRNGFNEAQQARVESVGVLSASGLIAGEALTGLVVAAFNLGNWKMPSIFEHPSYLAALIPLAGLAYMLIRVPLFKAGSPDEPAPPVVMM